MFPQPQNNTQTNTPINTLGGGGSGIGPVGVWGSLSVLPVVGGDPARLDPAIWFAGDMSRPTGAQWATACGNTTRGGDCLRWRAVFRVVSAVRRLWCAGVAGVCGGAW